MGEDREAVNRHYGRSDVTTELFNALRAAGKDPAALTRDDLAALDEIHMRGRVATRELAKLSALPKGSEVLDVGCGIGGPARTFAAEFGFRVTGVDLTEAFVQAAQALTDATRVEPRPAFRVADATALPFPEGTFDGAFIQHVSMNVHDKPRLFREVYRVLRRGGTLAIYEICGGPAGGEPHFPVMWASGPATNFLRSAPELRALVREAGFNEEAWEDQTAACLAWNREVAVKAESDAPAVGPQLVLGTDLAVKRANTLRSLEERRIAVVRGRFTRP